MPLPDDVAVQTRVASGNMRSPVAALDLGLEHVVSVRVVLTRFERDYAAMNAAYALEFPEGERSVRTCVGVSALVRGALVELDCIARRP